MGCTCSSSVDANGNPIQQGPDPLMTLILGGKKSEGKRATTYDTALDEIMDGKKTPRKIGNSKDEWIEAKLQEAELEALRKDYLEQQEEEKRQEEEKLKKKKKKKKKSSTGNQDGEEEEEEADNAQGSDDDADGDDDDDDDDEAEEEEGDGDDEEDDKDKEEEEQEADASSRSLNLGNQFKEAVRKRHEEMAMRSQASQLSEGNSGHTSERKDNPEQQDEMPGSGQVSHRSSTEWGVQRQEEGYSTSHIPGSWEDQLDQMKRRKVFSDEEMGGMMSRVGDYSPVVRQKVLSSVDDLGSRGNSPERSVRADRTRSGETSPLNTSRSRREGLPPAASSLSSSHRSEGYHTNRGDKSARGDKSHHSRGDKSARGDKSHRGDKSARGDRSHRSSGLLV